MDTKLLLKLFSPNLLLLCWLLVVLAGCASAPPSVEVTDLPRASKPQAPADLMVPAPARSSFLTQLQNAFMP